MTMKRVFISGILILVINLLFSIPAVLCVESSSSGYSEEEHAVELPSEEVKRQKIKEYYTPSVNSLTLTDTPAIELPASYEVMDNEWMEELGIVKHKDSWKYVSGVWMSEAPFLGTAAGGSSTVRGFGSTETTINSFPVPKEVNLYMDSAAIDRTEFFKGSAAAVQGAYMSRMSSVGGGINVVTKTPQQGTFFNSKISGRLGDGKQSRLQFDYNNDLNNYFLFRLNMAGTIERPFYLPSKYDANTGYIFAPGISILPGNNVKIDIEYSYQHEDAASYYGVPLVKGKLLSDYDEYYGDDNTRTDYSGNILQAQVNWDINNIFTLKAGGSYLKADIVSSIRGMSFGASRGWNYIDFYEQVYDTRTSPFGIFSYDSTYKRKGFFSNLKAEFESGEFKDSVVFGVDYLDSKSDSVSVSSETLSWYDLNDPAIPDSPELSSNMSYSYGSHTRRESALIQNETAWKSWRIFSGGRFDDQTSYGTTENSDTTFSYRLGVTYLINSSYALYGTYSNTQGPNLGYIDTSGDPITDCWSTELYEAGFKFQPTRQFLGTLAAFKIKQSNIPIIPDLTQRNVAELSGEEESEGFEFTLSGKITDNLSTRTSYTYLKKGDNSTDTKVYQNMPKHDLALWLKYNISVGPLAKLQVGTSYKHVAKRDVTYRGMYLSNEYILPGYDVLGIFMEYPWKLKSSDLDLKLNIENVFDEEYFDSIRHMKANPGEPFNVMFTLSFNY